MSFAALPPDPSPTDPEGRLTSRLDRLEHVLRDELARQKHRADHAEAQLRAFGQLGEQAEDLVGEARAQASRILEAARHELDRAAATRLEADDVLRDARREAARIARGTGPDGSSPTTGAGGLDEELLVALRDHLIDTGALRAQMMTEARDAVIELVQASSQARGATVLRPVPFGPAQRQASR